MSLDLGFVSFENDYDYMEVFIRHKKPPKSKKNPETKLTELEKQCLPRNLGGNKIVARKRIFVEHALTNIPLK